MRFWATEYMKTAAPGAGYDPDAYRSGVDEYISNHGDYLSHSEAQNLQGQIDDGLEPPEETLESLDNTNAPQRFRAGAIGGLIGGLGGAALGYGAGGELGAGLGAAAGTGLGAWAGHSGAGPGIGAEEPSRLHGFRDAQKLLTMPA